MLDPVDHAARLAALGAAMVERIRRIKQVIDAWESGDKNSIQTVSEIEDLASGEAERIVRVGNQHTPEIQS
jgi:hypothetical protein